MSSADRRRAPRFVSVSGSAVFGGGGAVTVLIACGGDGEVKAEDRHARQISSNADSRDRDMVDMLTVIVASRGIIPTRAINTISAIIMAVRIWCWFVFGVRRQSPAQLEQMVQVGFIRLTGRCDGPAASSVPATEPMGPRTGPGPTGAVFMLLLVRSCRWSKFP